jgi:hypothetical protein
MVIIAGMPGLMRSPAVLGYTQEEVLTALRDAVEVYADTGAEVIGEMLSKREIRAQRGRIVPLPL